MEVSEEQQSSHVSPSDTDTTPSASKQDAASSDASKPAAQTETKDASDTSGGTDSKKKSGKKDEQALMEEVESLISKLKEMTEYDNDDCLTILKRISQIYWNYTKLRAQVAEHFIDLCLTGKYVSDHVEQ